MTLWCSSHKTKCWNIKTSRQYQSNVNVNAFVTQKTQSFHVYLYVFIRQTCHIQDGGNVDTWSRESKQRLHIYMCVSVVCPSTQYVKCSMPQIHLYVVHKPTCFPGYSYPQSFAQQEKLHIRHSVSWKYTQRRENTDIWHIDRWQWVHVWVSFLRRLKSHTEAAAGGGAGGSKSRHTAMTES